MMLRRRIPALPALLLACIPVLSTLAQPSAVRVRLLEQHDPQAIRISGGTGALNLYAAGYDAPLARLAPGESAVMTVRNEEVYAALSGGGIYALSLRVEPEAGALVTVDVVDGQELKAPRSYSGYLLIAPDPNAAAELRLVNHVELEEYVAGVLPREYPFDDLEGAKAMAVVIRTYALQAIGRRGADYDHVDHVASQVYEGATRIPAAAVRAAAETAGEVLMYEGEMIEAVYCASSGGHTADNESVWGSAPIPYLRGKPDPYEASPHAQWQSRIDRGELLRALSRHEGQPVEGFVLGPRSREGRVRSVDLLLAGGRRRTVPGNTFRLLVNRDFGPESLKSTLFDARRAGEAYLFEGQGYGHGVGLSQWGAHEMATRGHTYREILAFYYTGTTLHDLERRGRTPLAETRTRKEETNSRGIEAKTARTAAPKPAGKPAARTARPPVEMSPEKPPSKPTTRRAGW